MRILHGRPCALVLASCMSLVACASAQRTDDDDGGGAGTTSSGQGGEAGQGGGGGGCVAEDETCNGEDDDCDGEVDEGCSCAEGETQECYSGPRGTADVGTCAKGTQTCTARGTWGPCTGETLPAEETCNGLDDDCSGAPDDLPDVTCGIGACQVTVPACEGGAPVECVPLAPTIEVCDGLDNDCDQETDESFPDVGGSCDTGMPGICSPGTKACINAVEVCVPNAVPVVEACNGLDDDCNGIVDDNVPGTGGECSTGELGVCYEGAIQCQGGITGCFPITPASPEVCDGLDNDCDGGVDDGDPEGGAACQTGQLGACAAGTEHCVAGTVQCVPDAQAQPEACNGTDDNCNGQVDEGNPGGGGPCSCGGSLECVGGQLLCQNCTREFVCNDGIDDDGDSLVDCSDPDCSFACSLPPCAPGQTLVNDVATDVPKAINDLSTVLSNLQIDYFGTVQRAAVRLINLTHTYTGDLDISFKGASTPSVDLSSDNGLGGANYINTTFLDSCATPIVSGSAPFSGCFSPEAPLAALIGAPVSQTWTLSVTDDAGLDTGTLNSWAVAFCVSTP